MIYNDLVPGHDSSPDEKIYGFYSILHANSNSCWFVDKIVLMMLLIPVLISFIFAISIVIIRIIRPQFRYHWIIAVLGSLLSLTMVIIWYFDLPMKISFPAWKVVAEGDFTPILFVDQSNWPIAISIYCLGFTSILISNFGKIPDPIDSATILVLSPAIS